MDDDKIAELRLLLAALIDCETAPEDGPFYLHELIRRPSTLIEFLRLHLPEPAPQAEEVV